MPPMWRWRRPNISATRSRPICATGSRSSTTASTPAAQARPGVTHPARQGGPQLTRDIPVVTYVTRNIEPMRGAHIVLRSLPYILDIDPELQVVIIGGKGTSYSGTAPEGQTWFDVFRQKIERPGRLVAGPYRRQSALRQFVKVLQVSSAHIYMTYPFVLSWSLHRIHGARMPDRGLGYGAGARDHPGRGERAACSPSSTRRRWPSGCAKPWPNKEKSAAMARERPAGSRWRNTISRPSACRNGASFSGSANARALHKFAREAIAKDCGAFPHALNAAITSQAERGIESWPIQNTRRMGATARIWTPAPMRRPITDSSGSSRSAPPWSSATFWRWRSAASGMRG